MSLTKVSWGIIGCGDVAEVKSGPAFYKLPDSELVAVMRRDVGLAADYARRHNVPRYYSNANELIADPGVTAIYVATPHSSHCEYTLRALKAGKPVYVEKPMGINYAECLKMMETSKQYNTPLYVAYYRRSLPYFIKVKELLDSGAIGSPTGVLLKFSLPPQPSDYNRGLLSWRLRKDISGGGYLLDMGSHQINILQFFFGRIVDVVAEVENRAGLYDVEDYARATLTFESGLTVNCVWNFAAIADERTDSVQVSGTRGVLRFSVFFMENIHLINDRPCKIVMPKEEHVQMPHIRNINNFILHNDFNSEWTEDAAQTSLILDKILSSRA